MLIKFNHVVKIMLEL